MDSLTQITLGAAMGEAVLGKKIGNRAMMWGAIGGTIPDLDVVANFFMEEMDALAFHRGISHSFLFAFTVPFFLGWLVWRLYHSGAYQRKGWRSFVSVFNLALLGAIAFGINYIPFATSGSPNYVLLGSSASIFVFAAWKLWSRYLRGELPPVEATYRDWVLLFFWSIFTHPVLDAFTPFGTQLFYPFSNYRVAFNNIAVVDPIYTVPFLLCVIIAAVYHRSARQRAVFNWLGIGLSSAYMVFTLYNKWRVDHLYEQSLRNQNIPFERFTTSPTIFNNILWQGTAESDTAYHFAFYSFLDKNEGIPSFVTVPKNHELLAGHENDKDIHTLKWFSKNYFNIIRRKDGKLQLNDLRYGSQAGTFADEHSYIFRFILEENGGKLHARQTREGSDVSKKAFADLWARIKGV